VKHFWSNPLPFVLSAGNFVIGLGAFVVIGLISPIADKFKVTPDQAGLVLTYYAMAYALGAPLVTALTGKVSRRLALTGGLVLFGLGAAGSAFASSIAEFQISRVIVALGAGLFTPGAAAVAVTLSRPENRARALSVVFAGLTLAQVLGVPLGSWAGYTFGIADTFWVIAGLALVAAVLVFVTTPASLPFQSTSLSVVGEILLTPRFILPVLYSTTFMTAIYVVYTYLGPLVEARYEFSRDGVAAYFLLFGAAAVFGNFLGGYSADRIGPSRTLIVLCIAQVILLPTIVVAPVGPVAMGVIVVIWSLSGWSYMTPQQSRIVATAPERAPALLSLNASAILFGVALGSAIGGQALTHGGWPLVAATSAIIAVCGLAHLVVSDRFIQAPDRGKSFGG
jgi:MFS transporter, DHA1 family, inner membrane transport protein